MCPVQSRPHLQYEDHVRLTGAEPDLTEGQVSQSQTLIGSVVVITGLESVARTYISTTLNILYIKLSD